MNPQALLGSTILAAVLCGQLKSEAQPAAKDNPTARLNYLRGLTNDPPPAPGLHMPRDKDGKPVMDPISAAMDATIQSNMAFYASMDHGKIVNPHQIRPTDEGAIADYGDSKVTFPANLYDSQVRVITPDGKLLLCRPTYLVLANRSTGEQYLLAAITNTTGVITDSGIDYTSAFDGLDADVRFVYGKSSLEQYIVLHEDPGIPDQWKNERDLSLECWTEWFDTEPLSVQTNTTLLRVADDTLPAAVVPDCTVDFGSLKITPQGRAFDLDDAGDSLAVGKRWATMTDEGTPHRFLIETVDYQAAKPKLQKLHKHPHRAAYQKLEPKSLFTGTSSSEASQHQSGASHAQGGLATTKSGFVVDYDLTGCYRVLNNILPVSWWEGEGDANDLEGRNNGISYNGAAYVDSGKRLKAFNFNGVNQHVRVSNANGTLSLSASITIECWIWPAALGAWQNIVSKWDAIPLYPPQMSYAMGLYPDGRVYFGFSYDGSGQNSASALSTSYLPAGQWTHVAGTFDGASIRIYVNGVCQNTVPFSHTIYPGSDDIGIGGCVGGLANGSVAYPFNGLIDEVSIYSTALNVADINGIYAANTQGKCSGGGGGGGGGGGCSTVPGGIHNWWIGNGTPDDCVGNATMTISSGVSYVPAEVNQGFRFDGVSGVGNTGADLMDYGAMTVEMWVKPFDSAMRPIVEWGDTSWLGVHIWANYPSPGCLYCNFRAPNGDHPISCSGLNINYFNHIAVKYDMSTGYATLYINGSPQATTYFGVIGFWMGPCNFGKRVTTWAGIYYFYGIIDEPAFYDRALSDPEIAAIASAGSSGKCSMALLPVIVTQPQFVTVYQGKPAAFSVAASGTGPLSYQWVKDGTALVGATSASYAVKHAQASDAGTYHVSVSNSAGSVDSISVNLIFVPDADLDGVSDAVELSQGTDPKNPDTDGDGVLDLVDAFPTDANRWLALPNRDPNDHQPPVIQLIRPINASPLQ